MNVFDRIFAVHRRLNSARRPVPKATLEAELECSSATIKRVIRNMRLYLDAPIAYDRDHNGYYYDTDSGSRFDLPGLWFNASELTSLLAMNQLLETVEPGLLSGDLAPIRNRLERILDSRAMGAGELARRTRVLRATARDTGPSFATVAAALSMRWQLTITYHGRVRDRSTTRVVSPQRLTYYRDNWYLDAWCHRATGLRSFSLDRIDTAKPLDTAAIDLDDETLQAELGAGYGILSGSAQATAEIVFSADAARWVADEQWHPDQRGEWLDDGRYRLCLLYAQAEELLRDVLAYGASAEIVAPADLRAAIADRARQTAALYAND